MSHAKSKLSVYGKLPISKEFLRVECVGGAATDFKEWMDSCFSDRAEGSAPLPEGWWSAMLYRPRNPREKDVVIAILRDSHDAGGERRFPIAVFVTIRARYLRKLPGTGLATTLQPFWQALLQKEAAIAQCESYSEFSTVTRTVLHVEWDPRHAAANFERIARRAMPDEWAEGLPGETGEENVAAHLIWRLRGLFKRLGVVDDPISSLAVRLPTSREISPATQTDLYLYLIERHLGRFPHLPTLFLPRSNTENSTMSILVRSIRELDRELLRPPGAACDGVVDLSDNSPLRDVMGFTSFRQKLHDDVFTPGGGLWDLAQTRLDFSI